MFYGYLSGAAAQTNEIKNETLLEKDSMVNIAYKTISKKDIIGPVATVRPSEYLDKSYSTYALHGVSSFIGGSNLWSLGNPLVLIDGVPRDIYDITTPEVDQISYLKGASAIVLYGSRAANGVILITTKRGKAGEFNRTVRVRSGINTPISYPKYLGSAEYMQYYNQALKNDGLATQYSDAEISKYASHSNIYQNPDVDYYSSDYLRKFSTYYAANAEFSGGTEKARFYSIIGAEKTNSLLNFGEGKNEGTNRLNIRGNIDLKLNDAITTFVNISAVFYNNRTAMGNYWSQAATLQPNRFAPLYPISLISKDIEANQKTINDSHNVIDGQYFLGGTQQYLNNPIADVYAGGYQTYTSRKFQYSAGIDVNLNNTLKGLTLHGLVAVDYLNIYTEAINKKYFVFSPTWGTTDSISSISKWGQYENFGTQNISNTSTRQLIDFNLHLDYENSFNQNHNVSAMLLAAGTMSRQTGDFQYGTFSNLGLQLSYNFAHRYYAEFSSAIVNSTKLLNKRVALSPTFSLAWLVSSEGFMKNIDVVNSLKISASAGLINTDLDYNSTDYFLYNNTYSSPNGFGWMDGAYSNNATTSSRGENKDLGYAHRKEFILGVDASLLNNKLGVKASVFSIEKNGIRGQNNNQYPSYFSTPFPQSSFVPYTNYAANQNNGFDLQINYSEKIGDVNLILGASATYVKTKALKRDELLMEGYRSRIGKPTDAIFGLESEGFFTDQADIAAHATQKFGAVKPGDIKYKDQNGDGVVDEKDEVKIGQWNSPFTCGLHFTAQWKDFTLFVLGTGSFGGTSIKGGSYYWVYGAAAKYSEVVRNSWTEETKTTATYPRLTTQGGDNNFRNSDFWAYNTNQFNISKVQLTYNIPQSILGKTPIKGVNIYISGDNLMMFAKNKDIMQLNVGSSPQTRFYNFGIKADF